MSIIHCNNCLEKFNHVLYSYFDMTDLKTYEKINEEIKFTEEETEELLKLSEKEILVLILSELKKISENTSGSNKNF